MVKGAVLLADSAESPRIANRAGALFRASREPPGDHLDFVERARPADIEGLLGWPAERDVLTICRRAAHRYDSKGLPLWAEDFDPASCGDVKPVLIVEGHAVRKSLDSAKTVIAGAAAFQRRKRA